MAEPRGLLDQLLGVVVTAAEPLEAALQDPDRLIALVADLGWVVDGGELKLDGLSAAMSAVEALAEARGALATYRSGGGAPALEGLLAAVSALAEALRTPPSAGATAGLPAPLADAAFWGALAQDLPSYLVTTYLQNEQVLLYVLLVLAGVIDWETPPESEGRVADAARPVLRWERIATFLRDPSDALGVVYGWGGTLDHAKLLGRLRDALFVVGWAPVLREVSLEALAPHFPAGAVPPEGLRLLRLPIVTGTFEDAGLARGYEAGLDILPVPVPGGGNAPAGIAIAPYAGATLRDSVPLGETVSVRFAGTVGTSADLGVRILPGTVEVFAPEGFPPTDFSLTLIWTPREPRRLLGAATGTRVFVAGADLALELMLDRRGPEVRLRTSFRDLHVVIDLSDADGFLRSLLGPESAAETKLSGSLLWSSRTGLHLAGSGALLVRMSIDRRIGGLQVQALSIAAGLTGDRLAVSGRVDAAFQLGPVSGVVEGLGVELGFESAPDGAIAGLRPVPRFMPPSGVGLVIDAQAVKGGGFVYFDSARGQYVGVLQLEIAKTIAVKAIGLIGTRMPDGSPGFSLLVLISAEGFRPFQLGMGFTLNGIGGLLGINRSVNIEPLRDGLKSGTLDSVLFPSDPVRNAPAIVSTLNSVFPARRDHYVFGPMAIIGWGSPTLLTLKLGLLLEFPDPTRLILLGRLAVSLPTPDEAVVRLQMDAIGVLDFDRGELSLDASLFDSRVAAFVITGDMALRIGWGAEPQFLLSIGGFNPRYAAPPGLRPLERLSISLAESDNPRLRLEAYLAVTSNTLQFGARLELYAAALGFSVEGHLGFDALLQFVPFGFVIDFSAAVAVRFGGQVIFSVSLDMTLSGPSPWRAVGSASFTFLLIHATIPIELQIGQATPQPAPELVDVRALLAAALADARNWASQLPAEAPPLVSLRDGGGPGVRVHPLAVLVVQERVVPLNRPIVRYGSARVSGAQTFALTLTDSDGGVLPFETAAVMDAFARSQYEDLRDDEKLTLPAFESMDCGLRLGLDEFKFAGVRDVAEGWETWLWDPVLDPLPQRLDDVVLDVPLLDPRPLAIAAGLRP